jgi:hypothetical protein
MRVHESHDADGQALAGRLATLHVEGANLTMSSIAMLPDGWTHYSAALLNLIIFVIVARCSTFQR